MKDKVKDIIDEITNQLMKSGCPANVLLGLYELETEITLGLSDLYREIGDLKHSNEYLKAELEKGDYVYKTLDEYEQIVGVKANIAFQLGWDMARITNDMLAQVVYNSDIEGENQ